MFNAPYTILRIYFPLTNCSDRIVMVEREEWLAVHYFRTSRVRHWVSQEVFLCPEFLMLKVYATVANIGIDFVPSSHPKAAAFGERNLPAAFIGGKAAGVDDIVSFLRTVVDIDDHDEEKQALCSVTRKLLGEAINFTVWGHRECFEKFSKPIMRDSMATPYAELYCSRRRTENKNKDLGILDQELKSFLKYLNSKIRSSKFFFSTENPSLCDIVLYSYLSVLLSVPEKFCPFFFAKSPDEDSLEIINRLRSFLLDFDDFLWQLNAQRAEHLDMAGPLPTAAKAALSGGSTELRPDTELDPETADEKPLLGTKERTQNIIFLSAAATVMAAVIYSSSK